jgi:hypothetical protein
MDQGLKPLAFVAKPLKSSLENQTLRILDMQASPKMERHHPILNLNLFVIGTLESLQACLIDRLSQACHNKGRILLFVLFAAVLFAVADLVPLLVSAGEERQEVEQGGCGYIRWGPCK